MGQLRTWVIIPIKVGSPLQTGLNKDTLDIRFLLSKISLAMWRVGVEDAILGTCAQWNWMVV